jgi:hypothetical protein
MRVQVGVRRFPRVALVAALASLSVAPTARGAGVSVDEKTASYTFSYFSDVKGLDVFTHYGGSSLTLQHDVRLSAQWVHDVVVFPAIDAAPGTPEAVDAITTASRPLAGNADPFVDFVKVRNAVDGSLSYGGANAGYYVSTESDYFAQMVSASYNHDFLGDNLNVSVGTSYSWDSIKPLEDADTERIADYRRTTHWNVVATQIVTPKTVFRLGAELNHVRGLQHDPYRNVYVAGSNVPEKHPNERSRRDVFVNLNQYIDNLSSVNLEYRFYDDDWGVTSHTCGVKLNQYVTDAFIVRYRYRYYSQAAAAFYRDDYTQPGGVDGYQTNDYRLGDFGAHLFGGRILYNPYRILGGIGFPKRAQLVLSYERYFNSNNFSANILETGVQLSF